MRLLPRIFAHRYRSITLVMAMVLLLSSSLLLSKATPADDTDCLTCHGDPTLTGEKEGKVRSLYVKESALKGTPHENNGCVSCHPDAAVEEFPHETPLQKVDCGSCHDEIARKHAASLHGRAIARGDKDAPGCIDCHGKHTILGRKNPKSPTYVMNIPATCGQCHREDSPVAKRHKLPQQDVIKNYSESIHGTGLFQGGLIVTAVCTSCHTSHNVLPHTDPQSTIHRHNIASTCMQCHAQIEQVHQRVIRGELWEKQANVIPACVDCHSPHKIRRVFYTEEFQDFYCLSCHKEKSLTRTRPDGTVDSLYVNSADIEHSIHYQKTSCIKCHPNVSRRKTPVCKEAGPVDCTTCHAEQGDETRKSIHGQLVEKGDPNGPRCTDCHGTHNVLARTDINAPIFTRNIPNLCAKCHREGEKAAVRYQGTETEVVAHYQESIHGKGLLESGLMVSAVCTNCHTAHRVLPSHDDSSSVHPRQVAKTCGTCHLGIMEHFNSSIHSPLLSQTDKKLPTCNSCHKSHEIKRVDRTDFRAQILGQCGECHQDVTETYFQTYHGKVSQLGSTIAAKCSDCHGSHSILPVTNLASTLSRNNIVETCKKCHPNSNRKFAGYLTHATHHNRIKYPILFYTFWAMTLLVIAVFAFFGLHTLMWIPRSVRERKRLKDTLASTPQAYMVRFKLFPRILHFMVIISFFGLAFTGMSLKFSGYEWAYKLVQFFGGVQAAGFIHRLCAIITFLYFGLHFMLIYRNAKKEHTPLLKYMFSPESLVPNKQDLLEFWQTIKWFWGKGEQPRYGRWTYWEKFDYFAVFWGVAIIGSTGLILWFPEFFTKLLPGWAINVATIIHSDEALLATGFIFTIHFFNTHFRPQKFPMDPVIFTGKVPLDEWQHERPREYEQLQEQGRLEEHLEQTPPPSWLTRSARIFGMTALVLGFGLVILILWAMVFLYR